MMPAHDAPVSENRIQPDATRHDLHAFDLATVDGTTVSLGQYAGRWLLVEVVADPDETPWAANGSSATVVQVVGEPAAERGEPGAWLVDRAGHFARAFPDVSLPAVYVVNPVGALVAILEEADQRERALQVVGSAWGRTGALGPGDVMR